MALRRTITVSITPKQDELIKSCLQSGRFANTSEVVRAALRLLDQEEEQHLAVGKVVATTSSTQSHNS